MSPSDPKPEHPQRGIQSIEVGGQLLHALAHAGRPLPLKELAASAGMAAAKAHPYLVSFGKIGLVEQDKASGRYGLGALALQLGLMSLQQADPVRLGRSHAGGGGQLFQWQRPAGVGQCMQQLAAHLDALDAALGMLGSGVGHGGPARVGGGWGLGGVGQGAGGCHAGDHCRRSAVRPGAVQNWRH